MMPDRFTIQKYNKLLKDFNVENEEQLLEKLEQNSLTLPCLVCGKELSINLIHFLDGDPICSDCLEDYNG